MSTVDLHTHVIPPAFIEEVRGGVKSLQARIEPGENGMDTIVHEQGYRYPLFEEFFDVDAKLARMNSKGISASFVSPAPPLFYYWTSAGTGADIARLVNDGVAAMVTEAPDQLRGVGTIPLQDVDEAQKELERIVDVHGFRMVEVGTSVEGVSLADKRFLPVLELAAALGVTVFAHPYYIGDRQGLEDYYLTNLIGNPLDTALTAAHLMFGGTLDALPRLRVLLAHGGGFLPYQLGRLAHGYAVRDEPKSEGASDPRGLMDRFFFDTITFSPEALGFLIELVGSNRVVIGTDTPFDMADSDPLATLNAIPGVSEETIATVASGTCFELTGWRPPA